MDDLEKATTKAYLEGLKDARSIVHGELRYQASGYNEAEMCRDIMEKITSHMDQYRQTIMQDNN